MDADRIKFLNASEIRRCLPMAEAINVMREAFIILSTGRAVVPERLQMNIPESKGTALFMPVYNPGSKRIGLKVVTVSPENPSKNLPQIHALALIFDADNGKPLAVMDGAYLTALRTGAASGLATDLLANSAAKTAAIFGAGAQGRTQLEAVCCIRPIEEALVFDPDQNRVEEFCREMHQVLNIPIIVAEKKSDIARADIICTATTSSKPVFDDHDLKPGVHINGVGSYKPSMQEIPSATVIKSRVIVDSRAFCMSEAGDLLIPLNQGMIDRAYIFVELGEIASGSKPGRQSDEEITLFKSVGNAVQDLAAAEKILAVAEKHNIGVEVPL